MDASAARAQSRQRSIRSRDRTSGADRDRSRDGIPRLEVRRLEEVIGADWTNHEGRGRPSWLHALPRGRRPFDRDFFHRPRRAVSLVHDVLRLAMELVNQAAALTMALAGLRP